MIPSKYTIMLADILDNNNLINALNSYPLYDNNYRETLNQKIINHYFYCEIGFETPLLFSHYLKCRLNEIMDKYNKLYTSELLKLDPLVNYSNKTTFERIINSNYNSSQSSSIDSSSSNFNNSSHNALSSSSSTSNNSQSTNGSNNTTEKHVFQDTPQGSISEQNINNYSYATNQNLDNTSISSSSSLSNQGTSSNNVQTGESSSNNSNSETQQNSNLNDSSLSNNFENYIKNITGNNNITSTKLYSEFVNNFNSIDSLIINELSDLFMLIF